jgi:hypothetical protein
VVAPTLWKNFINLLQSDPNSGQDFKQGLPVSNWPQGWGHSSTALYADGVANVVADPVTGQNSITLVAAGYAKVRNNWPVASLENFVGQFTQPDEDNVTIALSYATPNPDLSALGTFILHYDGTDPRAYFPSTYSYVLAQTNNFDPGKGAALGLFLCYAVSKGQVIAPQLRYARLSAPLVAIAINAISKIPGAPPANQCFLQGAPPPPQQPNLIGPGAAAAGPGGARAGTSNGAGGAATTGTGTAGATGGATNCTTASSTTTTTAAKASTTTTAPKSGATTTTTAPKSATTTTASTTTTTAPCSTNGIDANGSTSANLNGASIESRDLQGQLAAAQNQKQNGGGGLSDLGAVALGAGLCAVGTTIGRMRRGPS